NNYFRSSFDMQKNGWGYTPGSPATPSMTCAGLLGLAVSQGATSQSSAGTGAKKKSASAAQDPMAQKALQALGYELRIAESQSNSKINSDLYFFWSLERVGVVYDVKRIGGIDWYAWGCKRLLAGQNTSGEWSGRSSKGWTFGKGVGTSFGILFLSRANVARDLTAVVGSGGGVGSTPRTAPLALEGDGAKAEIPGGGGGSMAIRRAGSSGKSLPQKSDSGTAKGGNGQQKETPGPPVLDPF
ncbi:MAG: hypothetical protein ABGW78_16745, partial [Pirellulales bacterium]